MPRRWYAFGLALLTAVTALAAPLDRSQIRRDLAGLAIPFEENAGQHDPQVAYAARIASGATFVTRDGRLVHSLRGGGSTPGWTLVESFSGAALDPRGVAAHTAGVTYLRHGDAGPRHARTWGSVSLGEPWPGIEVSVVARGAEVEKLFTVAPGAQASTIRVTVAGARSLRVDDDGALVAETDDRTVRFTAPIAWQEIAGERRPVHVAYDARDDTYGFRLGVHDPKAAVVIDPILQSATFGGTNFDLALAILREPAGTVLVSGAASNGYPGTAGGAQPTFVGGIQNGFVARLSNDLATIIQATYFGGPISSAAGIAVDPAGNVFIAGREVSGASGPSPSFPPLPGTSGAAQPSPGGGSDAFVAKLSADLRSLVRATYLGGSADDHANALVLDAAGNVLVAGETGSSNFPGVAGGAQATLASGKDAFIARVSNDLSTVVRSTYLGGLLPDSAFALALDTAGNIYVAGETESAGLPGVAGGAQPAYAGGTSDAFVARFTPDLETLVRSTYLGGGGFDRARAIALAPAGAGVYVTGTTDSANFPATAGGAQATRTSGGPFVALLGADLGNLVQATYLGGNSTFTSGNAIAVDGSTVVVAGQSGGGLPGTTGGAQPFFDDSSAGFVSRLAGDLRSVVQSTYISTTHPSGASLSSGLNAVAIEPSGNVLVAGITGSDVYVARITGDLRALPPAGFLVTVGPRVARGGNLIVTVTARDSSNQTAVGYSGTVGLATTDGAAVISPATRTLTRGVGTFTVTFNSVGSHTISAVDTVDSALAGNAATTVSNVAHIVLAPPASAMAGAQFAASVTAYDGLGNVLPGARLRFTSSTANAAMPPDFVTPATTAQQVFRIMAAGDHTLTATDLREPGVAATSSPITITPSFTQRLFVSAPAEVSPGMAFTATVEARDLWDNFTPAYQGVVGITSSDTAASLPPNAALSNGKGTFAVTLNTAGSHTIVATATVQTSVTGAALVEVVPAVRFTIAAPASATAGAPFDVTVSARSPDGTLLTGYAGTIRFWSTDAAAVLPASATLSGGTGVFSVVLKTAGQRTISVTDAANAVYVGTSSAVSVAPAPAAALAVSAPTLALPGVAFNVVVSARDAFGNLAPGNTSTVHLASSDGAALLPADAALANGTRSFAVTLATQGTQTVTASDVAAALTPVTSAGISVSALGVSPVSIDFGGQSMGTTSPPVDVTVLTANPSALALALPGTQFSQTNDCAAAAPNTPCTIRVAFSPSVAAGPLNGTSPAAGTLTVTSPSAGSRDVALSGVGEKSLVSHYYRSILRRAPDAGGKAFWSDEAARVSTLGANVNEVWFAMALQFYSSPEYVASSGNNTAFTTDLYNTFFNRLPDVMGLAYWVGQLDQGMPRGVLIAEFMFSAEFRNFTQAIFGQATVRAEVDMVMDFYRGLLGRVPDSSGFDYWLGRFRAAQCEHPTSGAVYREVEAISREFALSQEYAARTRDNPEYVGDLYNAFLRRGGDRPGVLAWIGQLDSGAQSREQVRAQFRASSEFQRRVGAILSQGCLP